MKNADIITDLYEEIGRRYRQANRKEPNCCNGPACGMRPLIDVLDVKQWLEVSFFFNELCRENEALRARIDALEGAPRALPSPPVRVTAELIDLDDYAHIDVST